MAKYNWELIENAYINGVEVDVICKEYYVTKKTLQNRIYSKKLEVKLGNINTTISEVGQHLGNISGIAQNDPILEKIIEQKIDTMAEDNKLIGGNRKLLGAFQSLIGKGIREGMYKTAQDINMGVSAVKNIEAVTNPTTKPDVAIQNNNQQTPQIVINVAED
jgi:hypothetical protein